MLTIKDLDVCYGEFQALYGVSLDVAKGETVAVIGANGAGKTTLIHTIAGALAPKRGEIRYKHGSIGGKPAFALNKDGIALVPEGRKVFPSLSVEENLLAGAYTGRKGQWTLNEIYALFPILKERARQPGAQLSGGQQQMIAIGRALMSNPDLILMDEISLGLAPVVVAAYLALACGQLMGLSPFVSLLIVVPVFFIFGVLLQRGLLNRLLGKGLMPPLLVTFGFSVILQNVLQLVFSADSRGLEAGAIETASIQLGGISLGVLPLVNLFVAVAMLGALQLFLSKTALGRAFRATSDDPETAELMGISSHKMYGLALGLSLAVVAVSGVLLGIRTNFAPTDGPSRLIYAFEAVIIGGLGSLWGTLFGGMILGVAQNLGAQIGPTWFQLAGHVVTIAVLAFRPTGLFARTREANV